MCCFRNNDSFGGQNGDILGVTEVFLFYNPRNVRIVGRRALVADVAIERVFYNKSRQIGNKNRVDKGPGFISPTVEDSIDWPNGRSISGG